MQISLSACRQNSSKSTSRSKASLPSCRYNSIESTPVWPSRHFTRLSSTSNFQPIPHNPIESSFTTQMTRLKKAATLSWKTVSWSKRNSIWISLKQLMTHQQRLQAIIQLRRIHRRQARGKKGRCAGNGTLITSPSTSSSTTTGSLKCPRTQSDRRTARTRPFCQTRTSSCERITRTW